MLFIVNLLIFIITISLQLINENKWQTLRNKINRNFITVPFLTSVLTNLISSINNPIRIPLPTPPQFPLIGHIITQVISLHRRPGRGVRDRSPGMPTATDHNRPQDYPVSSVRSEINSHVPGDDFISRLRCDIVSTQDLKNKGLQGFKASMYRRK